jgi:iron complex transport system ATP-binding protein
MGSYGPNPIARRIAMVPQNGGGYYSQTVFQFAMQGRSPHLSLLGFESEADENITHQALEMTHLTQFRDSPVSQISGGEKQRLLLARALVQQPEILLLDELTANLDINFQVELLGLVRRITREKGLATLVVSHEINLVSGFSDHTVLMLNGRILHQGPVGEMVTPANLKEVFGMNFAVRMLSGGVPEVLPILNEENTDDYPIS